MHDDDIYIDCPLTGKRQLVIDKMWCAICSGCRVVLTDVDGPAGTFMLAHPHLEDVRYHPTDVK